jgi:Serine carboxypeptidase
MFRLVALFVLSLSSCLLSFADAQFIAQPAPNLTTIRSPLNPNITISYKSPDKGICKTAFDFQKQYTGWVNIPTKYPTNLFFWFVEARQQPANLTIWLNGGPGASSLLGFFTETGPCEVIEKGLNQWDTAVREWGWDRASNMLFIDQVRQSFMLSNARSQMSSQIKSAFPMMYQRMAR